MHNIIIIKKSFFYEENVILYINCYNKSGVSCMLVESIYYYIAYISDCMIVIFLLIINERYFTTDIQYRGDTIYPIVIIIIVILKKT